MDHEHNGDPVKGPVCSHLCTDEVLVALGYVTKRTDEVVGTPVVSRPGITYREAIMAGFRDGTITICSLAPPAGGYKNTYQSDQSRAAHLLFANAILRAKDQQ